MWGHLIVVRPCLTWHGITGPHTPRLLALLSLLLFLPPKRIVLLVLLFCCRRRCPLQIFDLSFTLTEEEQADGMALICMSRPLTDVVVMETQSDWGYSLGVAEWKGATGHIGGREVGGRGPVMCWVGGGALGGA